MECCCIKRWCGRGRVFGGGRGSIGGKPHSLAIHVRVSRLYTQSLGGRLFLEDLYGKFPCCRDFGKGTREGTSRRSIMMQVHCCSDSFNTRAFRQLLTTWRDLLCPCSLCLCVCLCVCVMYLREELVGVMAGLFGGGGLKKMAAYFRTRAEGQIGLMVTDGIAPN